MTRQRTGTGDRTAGPRRRPLLAGVAALAVVAALLLAATPGLAQAPPLCSFAGPDTTDDQIELTDWTVTGPNDPPEPGDEVTAAFTLTNVGAYQFDLAPDGIFINATTPSGPDTFGRQGPSSLGPGDSYDFVTNISVTEGSWSLWPAYEGAGGERSPSPWHPCDLEVQSPDTDPPTVSVEVTPETAQEDETFSFRATATDDSGIAEITIEVDGGVIGSCADSPCVREGGPFDPGSHEVRATARDTADNVATTGPVAFDVVEAPEETKPPKVKASHTPITPFDTDLIILQAEAFDESGIVRVAIHLDGTEVARCLAPTCRYAVPRSLAESGEHTYWATAEDGEGNVGESLHHDLVIEPDVKIVLPDIAIFSPKDRTSTVEDTVTLEAIVNDDDLDRVHYEVHYEGMAEYEYERVCNSVSDVDDCPAGGITFTDEVPLKKGWNHIQVHAWGSDNGDMEAAVEIFRQDPAKNPFSVNVEHKPLSPDSGEAVTITAVGESGEGRGDDPVVTSVEIRAVPVLPIPTTLETCTRDGPREIIRCQTTVKLPPDAPPFAYYAVAHAVGDRTAKTPPRYVLFGGEDGVDSDDDGLTDTQERSFCTSPSLGDSDGDGLLDGWEVLGHRFPDGHVVDLPAMGANPCDQDVFLEIDWWRNVTGYFGLEPEIEHTHKPLRDTRTMMTNAFRDGGIRLHIDVGQWGGGEPTPHNRSDDSLYYDGAPEYWQRHEEHFDPHRLWSFNYAVFRHRTGRSSHVGANSVSVHVPDGAGAGFQTGELFHELGHAIGLGHGGRVGEPVQTREGDVVSKEGAWDDHNRKPNYLSSMNYALYRTVYWNQSKQDFVRSYDYSRAKLPTLYEWRVDERPDSDFAEALQDYPLPPGAPDDWRPVAMYSCTEPDTDKPMVAVTDGEQTLARRTRGQSSWQTGTDVPDHGPGIDWDCDGDITRDAGLFSAQNIDGAESSDTFYLNKSDWKEGETLEGRDDWSKIPVRSSCPARQRADEPKAFSDDYIDRAHDPACYRPSAGSGGGPSRAGSAHHQGPEQPRGTFPGELCDGSDDDGDGEVDEGCRDRDGDGTIDALDVCPNLPDSNQTDSDGDGLGDACSGPLPAPTDLLAERRNETTVALEWAPVEGAEGYTVRRAVPDDGEDGGVEDLVYLGGYPTTNETVYLDADAPPGELRYLVRPVGADSGQQGQVATVAISPGGPGGEVLLGLAAVLVVGVGAAGFWLWDRGALDEWRRSG